MSQEVEILDPEELTPEELLMETELEELPEEVQILILNNPSSQGMFLLEQFKNYFLGIAAIEQEAKAIEVTDSSQLREMKKARELRLMLRDHRVNAGHKHKELKEPIKINGKLIDAFKNIIEGMTKPLEAELQEKEDFAKNEEAKRVKKLNDERLELLKPYDSNADFLDLAGLSQKDFEAMLSQAKQTHAELQAEADLIAKQEKDKAEREEKLIKENEQLRHQIKAVDQKTAMLPVKEFPLEEVTLCIMDAIQDYDQGLSEIFLEPDKDALRKHAEKYAEYVKNIVTKGNTK